MAAAVQPLLPGPVDTIERLRVVETLARAAGEPPDPLNALIAAERILRSAGLIGAADMMAAARTNARKYDALVGQVARGAVSPRECRNEAYRQLAALLLPAGASVNSRAQAVERAVSRYQASTWRHDKRAGRASLPADDIERRIKFNILASGASPLGLTSLRQLLGKKG